MEKMREEFEEWSEKQGYVIERYADDDHGYVFADTDECWNAWKASRAVLCVELPEHCEGLALTVSELKKQLCKIGVTLK